MRYKSTLAGVTVAGLVTLAACGEAPDDSDSGSNGEASFSACMVTDSGGVDDQSFNESSWNGLEAAADANDDMEASFLESASEEDFTPNLQRSVDNGCEFIIGVGGLLAIPVTAVAQENPDIAFAIVDGQPTNPDFTPAEVPNIYSIEFDTAQAAFLAGYLSAGTTETGTVATWGGMQINAVTIFMDGFAGGVAHYNEVKGTDVEVLGWDVAGQTGSFTEDFNDAGAGKSLTETFLSQGADIVLPVAGPAGIGALSAAEENDGLNAIWVDVDGCEATEYCDILLTTVEKGLTDAVQLAAENAYESGIDDGVYVGDLENGGVSIAPYHEFEDAVDAELQAEVEQLQADIISGTITAESAASPVAE